MRRCSAEVNERQIRGSKNKRSIGDKGERRKWGEARERIIGIQQRIKSNLFSSADPEIVGRSYCGQSDGTDFKCIYRL